MVWRRFRTYYYSIKAIDSVGAASELSSDLVISSGGTKWIVDAKTTRTGIGSNERPFLTVNNALRYVIANDTILIKPGVYKENINVRLKPIVFTSDIISYPSNADSIIQNKIIA